MCDVTVSDAKVVSPWVALDAVTDTGASAVVDLGGVSNEFTLHMTATGAPFTDLQCRLEGSLDNVNWFSIISTSSTIFSANQVVTTEVNQSGNKKPHARYVRANLTDLAGGTSPTVTVSVAVGKIR